MQIACWVALALLLSYRPAVKVVEVRAREGFGGTGARCRCAPPLCAELLSTRCLDREVECPSGLLRPGECFSSPIQRPCIILSRGERRGVVHEV